MPETKPEAVIRISREVKAVLAVGDCYDVEEYDRLLNEMLTLKSTMTADELDQADMFHSLEPFAELE